MKIANNQNTLIVGVSGVGKHLFATQRIIDNLVDGRTVVVLDVGRSHAGLAELMGGTEVRMHTAQQRTVKQFGTMPLTVFNLEDIMTPVLFEHLGLPAWSSNTFLLVDEAHQVSRRVIGLWAQLKKAMDQGTPVVGVIQGLADIEQFAMSGVSVQTVRKPELVPSGEWQSNQLCRHQDGGIYRFLFTSKHTDDLSELVNYEHVWPFEPGAKWSRPVTEWSSRFTPISVSELVEAQKTDRATAQAAIAQAKATRRAAQ